MSAIDRIKGYCCEVTKEQWRELVKVADEVWCPVGIRSRREEPDSIHGYAECFITELNDVLALTKGSKSDSIPFDSFIAKLRGEEKTLRKVTDLGENEVIHCSTLEDAKAICNLMHEAGLKWVGGDTYLDDERFLYCKGETCYRPKIGGFGALSYYQPSGFTVHPASDFIAKAEDWTPVAGEMVEVKKWSESYYKKAKYIGLHDNLFVCYVIDLDEYGQFGVDEIRPTRPTMTREQAEEMLNCIITDNP